MHVCVCVFVFICVCVCVCLCVIQRLIFILSKKNFLRRTGDPPPLHCINDSQNIAFLIFGWTLASRSSHVPWKWNTDRNCYQNNWLNHSLHHPNTANVLKMTPSYYCTSVPNANKMKFLVFSLKKRASFILHCTKREIYMQWISMDIKCLVWEQLLINPLKKRTRSNCRYQIPAIAE